MPRTKGPRISSLKRKPKLEGGYFDDLLCDHRGAPAGIFRAGSRYTPPTPLQLRSAFVICSLLGCGFALRLRAGHVDYIGIG
jgi:hypothetical protein